MINKIKQWFGWITVETLQTQSESILNVFNKTAVDLEIVNNQIQTEIEKRDAKIGQLIMEQEKMDNIKGANQKVIDKINSFLS